MQQIDFVIPWVDGSDPAWQAEFRQYRIESGMDASAIRYRDWGTLPYWFRAVEQFAPWVHKIHLITWGHIPAWLDTSHPKLNIVRHEDYIPKEWLPTFNANPIELNIHRIESLSEYFVLFNDDMFLTRPCVPEDFFREGLPCDMARLNIIRPSSIGPLILNNVELINNLHTRKALDRHLGKWLTPCYGLSNLLKTITLLPWSFFPGFYDSHQAQPYRKSDFERAWQQWGEALAKTSSTRFRDCSNVTEWLIRYDTLCRGEFVPRSMADCRMLTLADESVEEIAHLIATGAQRLLCLHDSTEIRDFEQVASTLLQGFEQLLPQKSSYEK